MPKIRVGNKQNSFLNGEWAGHVIGFWKKYTSRKRRNKDKQHTKNELNVKLQIEGLKSEKRMIQSTDRKILDVNRQTEIDNEITKLQNNIK